MKKIGLLGAVMALVVAITACGNNKEQGNVRESIDLTNAGDSLCYAVGVGQAAELKNYYGNDTTFNMELFKEGFTAGANDAEADIAYYMGYMQALQMKEQVEQLNEQMGIEGNYAAFATGYMHVMNDDSTYFSSLEAQRIMQKTIREAQERMSREALEEGRNFLAAKEKEAGVNKTESGLLYKVIIMGTGEKFKDGETVKCNYRGTFIDGKEFDKGDGVDFTIGRMIPGFNEAMTLMSPGARYELYIPSELAYGSNPHNGMPANAVLVFELETIELVK